MASLREFAHIQIPIEDIVTATNNFADANLIGEGEFVRVYRGELLRSGQLIDIAVRRLHRDCGQGEVEFVKEISMLSRLKHENIISMVGFCDTNDEKIIVNKLEVHGSLDKYLSAQTLTWMQRLQICVGAAHALSYIHYDVGRNYGVIHRNIKSSKILLDDNWKAKMSGFGLSIVNPTARKHRLLLSRPCGMFAYVDPVYMKTGGVTDKSDVYSFGIVLFEVLCGRKAFVGDEINGLLANSVKLHYDEGKLDELIDPDLRKQMDPQSLIVFSDTAYDCLKEHRAERPDMDQIVKRLENALKIQRKLENSEHPTVAVEGTSPNRREVKNLDHLKIPLKEIKLATGDFDIKNHIGGGGYGAVYKAKLNLCDDINSSGGHEMMLVCELSCNGSLDKYLGSNDSTTNLTWRQRIQICLDVARGLNYLHTNTGDKHRIIHRDVKSTNILLGENWEAKIADFGLSRIGPANQQVTYVMTNVAGTSVYLDPEYDKTGILTKESDVYSFGVVLFEVLCGRLAHDPIYNVGKERSLAPMARRFFKEGKLHKIIDPKIKGETDESIFTLNKGANEDSLDTFSKIAYQCLAETQAERPTMDVVIRELEKALNFQVNRVDIFKILLKDILLATNNFSNLNLIGVGGFGDVYRGEVSQAGGRSTIAVKRLVAERGQGEQEFLNELEILFEYKHKNVIGLVGYCNEMDEKIIVYEYASHGSLDKYLSNASLTWMKRMKICIDVASGLDFLHGGVLAQERVIHRDIKSSNILLNYIWEAKITDFGISMISQINQQFDYVVENPAGTFGYVDPLYEKMGVLTKESDIYSFGVVLFEILSGRNAGLLWYNKSLYLSTSAKHCFEEGKLDEIIFDGIKKQIVPESLTTFARIAYQCLHDEREERPTTGEVLQQLRKALEFQEDVEVWKPTLPRDYQQIIKMSKSQKIYSTQSKKDLHDLLCKGILLQNGKVERWVSSKGGVTNETISATNFSYKNLRSFKWRSIRKSRFSKVAKMLDLSNLNILIKIKTQFLSPGKIYGVYLVFKFWDKEKVSNEPIYLNLRYQKASKTLNAYYAEWKDEEWMMIELDQFLNHENSTEFEILVERLSCNNCGSCAIFVEGIEFRAINKVEHEENEKPKLVEKFLRSDLNGDQLDNLLSNHEEVIKRSENYVHSASKEELYYLLSTGISIDKGQKVFFISKVNGKKCHMLPAKAVLYDSSHVNRFNWRSLPKSRFAEVGELLPIQVLRIKCNIETQMLSPSTTYACYVVYKISKKSHGLKFPVKVRDQHSSSNKEINIVYFRSPSPVTFHNGKGVPGQREDGWMEVMVWEFVFGKECNDDYLPMDLKLVCFEGKMSGLIVCGIEFRPV